MELRRLWTMFVRTFVTVPVISLLIFTVMVDLFSIQFQDWIQILRVAPLLWYNLPFHFVMYMEEGFKIASACSILGVYLFFSLICSIVGHLLLGLGAGSSPVCCCYFMYLKALNRCFFGWWPIDQHLHLFSQLASTLQRSELDVSSNLAWTQMVLWRKKCSDVLSAHTLPTLPPLSSTHLWGPWW